MHRVHPALAVPEQVADAPEEALVLLPQDAEETDAVPIPLLEHALDPLGYFLPAQSPPAEEADDLGVSPELGVAVQVAGLGLPEDQSLGLEPH